MTRTRGGSAAVCLMAAIVAFAPSVGRCQGMPGYRNGQFRRNPRPRADGGRPAASRTSGRAGLINPHDAASPVGLSSDLEALRERHTGALTHLPMEVRHFDSQAMRLVDELPLLAQAIYLGAIEDYPTLEAAGQSQVRDVIRSLAELPEEHHPACIAAARKSFDALGADRKQLAEARKHPITALPRLQQAAGK